MNLHIYFILHKRRMSMFGFGSMIENLKKNPKSIVLTDGTDPTLSKTYTVTVTKS